MAVLWVRHLLLPTFGNGLTLNWRNDPGCSFPQLRLHLRAELQIFVVLPRQHSWSRVWRGSTVERGTCEPLAQHFSLAKHWAQAELCQDTHEVPGGAGLSCQGLREAESQILAALRRVCSTLGTGVGHRRAVIHSRT